MDEQAERLIAAGQTGFPGLLGIEVLELTADRVRMVMPVREELMAPNGFLHAGSLVSLADTAAGYGCVLAMPEQASGFTTMELKSNHLSTARDGVVEAVATPQHLGKTTQVWDVVVSHQQSGKKLALFRCSQLILYPRGS